MKTKVRNYIYKYHMIEAGDRVLCGVSSGADSVCLLTLLWELQEELNFSLALVHVNHGIRGAEAKRDEAYAEKLARHLEIPFALYHYDVPSLAAAKGLSVEEAGRAARRMAFADYANVYGCNKIALAHNKNDLAETVLMNLCRGTGLAGMCGIVPVRENIIRPLLCAKREEIEEELHKKNLEYMTDSTNNSDDYTRNKIRHHILPYLCEEINPETVEHIAATAAFASRAQEVILANVQDKCSRLLILNGDYLLIRTEAFLEADVSYILREALRQFAPGLKDITAGHIEDILGLAVMANGKRRILPYGIICEKTKDGVLLMKRAEENNSFKELVLTEDSGVSNGPDWRISWEFTQEIPEIIPKTDYTKWLDYDKITGNVKIRTRRSNDTICINEAGGTKKLRVFMIDEKIPRILRDSLPLVTMGTEVLWIPGYRISYKYRITPDTKRALKITIEKIEGQR